MRIRLGVPIRRSALGPVESAGLDLPCALVDDLEAATTHLVGFDSHEVVLGRRVPRKQRQPECTRRHCHQQVDPGRRRRRCDRSQRRRRGVAFRRVRLPRAGARAARTSPGRGDRRAHQRVSSHLDAPRVETSGDTRYLFITAGNVEAEGRAAAHLAAGAPERVHSGPSRTPGTPTASKRQPEEWESRVIAFLTDSL